VSLRQGALPSLTCCAESAPYLGDACWRPAMLRVRACGSASLARQTASPAARVTAASAAETIVEEDKSAEDRVFQEATATVERRFSPKAAAASAAYKAPRPPCGNRRGTSELWDPRPSCCKSASCAP